MKKLLGRGGPLGAFFEFPALLQLALVSTCAETTWATLLFVLEFYFKDELLRNQSDQFIASKIALAFLAFTGAETLFKYPMGTLADRYGPRRFVLLALSICTVTPLLMTLFGSLLRHSIYSWVPFIPLRACDGFAAAALWPAMSALMSRAVPREAKATAMSVFNAAYVLGLAVGPPLGLLVGHLLGTNLYVFPFTAGIMGIGLVLALRTVPHTPHGVMHGESIADERALLKGKPMLVRMMGLYALSQVGVGFLAPTLPLYLSSQFGLQQGDLPKLLPIPALLVLAIAIPLGRLPDTVGRAKSVWISYALAVIGMIGIAGSSLFKPTEGLHHLSLYIFGAGMIAMIISYILGTPAWLGLTSLQVPDSKQAQALSLMQTAQGMGVVVAYISVASAGHFLTTVAKVRARLHHTTVFKAVDTVPLSMWFWIALGVFTVCLIGTLLFVKEPTHEHEAVEEAKLVNKSVI
ncbi:hypothetical protein IAD21_01183 [Abditibacteriota bacterium]|nr:hypothetical protein IAD21_01183 [Abditibacteriota bacterium]